MRGGGHQTRINSNSSGRDSGGWGYCWQRSALMDVRQGSRCPPWTDQHTTLRAPRLPAGKIPSFPAFRTHSTSGFTPQPPPLSTPQEGKGARPPPKQKALLHCIVFNNLQLIFIFQHSFCNKEIMLLTRCFFFFCSGTQPQPSTLRTIRSTLTEEHDSIINLTSRNVTAVFV